ncbi:hypothetical protein BDF22DRAFT_683416 [Syncephalis plumigaleata]|nr:hypothetical protein BDF22DRAFT_683416 [Syncephalis plumigaleata]
MHRNNRILYYSASTVTPVNTTPTATEDHSTRKPTISTPTTATGVTITSNEFLSHHHSSTTSNNNHNNHHNNNNNTHTDNNDMTALQKLSLRGLDPLRTVTSNLVSPQVLLTTRGISCLYQAIVVICSIINQPTQGWVFFTFFTHLTFLGELAYFGVATYHTFRFTRYAGYVSPTLKAESLWTRAHFVLYSTVAVFHMLVPAVYWAVLYNPKASNTAMSIYLNVSKHGIDFVLLGIEFVLGRMIVPLAALPWVILTILFYMFWAWIAHSINGLWVYPFLNWDQPAGIVAAWYIGVCLLVVAFFAISYGAHRLRDRLFRQRAERVEDVERLRRELRYRSSSAAMEMRSHEGLTYS